MDFIISIAIRLSFIFITFFLGMALYFVDNLELQAYFWFPLLLSFVALILGILEIKKLNSNIESDKE